ncbi:MAG: ImmA/IrrE family metallo-endopeptidase [Bacillota bacterium]
MEQLLKLVSDLNLCLIYIPLSNIRDGLFGLYSPATSTIFLDIKLLEPKYYKLHRCVLAEEIGHRITGTSINTLKIHTSYTLKRKILEDEERAILWATEKLIPTNELIELLQNGFHNCEELADYFGVTVWFMFRKLQFIQIRCDDKNSVIRPIIKRSRISCF